MKIQKKGIPKSRLPEGLAGIVRKGKIGKNPKNFLFDVSINHHGEYSFKPDDARVFNVPKEGTKVYIHFLGYGKDILFPDYVCDLENKKIFYERK